MKILRLESRGFGCLPAGFEWSFAPNGLTLVLGNNEQGKSTLVQALLSSLYGETLKRGSPNNFLQQFTPWDQPDSRPGLVLDVNTRSGETLTITRQFGAKTNAVRVMDTQSRMDRTRDFQVDRKTFAIGDHPLLTGLSRTTFEKVACILQNSLTEFDNNQELVQAIQRVVISGETGITVQQALSKLEQASKHQQHPVRGTSVQIATILKDIEKEINRCLQEKAALENDFESFKTAFNLYQERSQALDTLTQELKKMKSQRVQAEGFEALEKIRKHDQLVAEIEALRQEQETFSAYATVPPNALAAHENLVAEYGRWQAEKDRLANQEHQLTLLKQEWEALQETTSQSPWTEWDMNSIERQRSQVELLHRQYQLSEARFKTEAERLVQSGFDWPRFENALAQFQAIPSDTLQSLYERLVEQRALQHTLTVSPSDPHKTQEKSERLLYKHPWRRIAYALFGATLLAGGSMIFSRSLPLWIGVALTGGFLLAAVAVLLLGQRFNRPQPSPEITFAEQQLPYLKAQYQRAVEALNLSRPDLLEVDVQEELVWFISHKTEKAHTAFSLYQEEQRNGHSLHEELQVLYHLLTKPQGSPSGLIDSLEALQPLLTHFEQAITAIDETKQAEKRYQQACLQLDQERQKTQQREQGIVQQLQTFLATPCDSVDKAMALFKASVEGYRQWHILQRELEEKQRHLLSDGEYQEILAQRGSPSSLIEPDGALLNLNEIRVRYNQLEQERDELKRELDAMGLQQIHQKQAEYYARYPQVQHALAEYQELLQRYQTLDAALDVAKTTLQGVSRDDYRQWSQWLNQRVNKLLSQFQLPYTEMRFNEKLDFSLYNDDGHLIQQGDKFERLSCGARDQIYLIVRLAIADYLSQDQGHLPLILDDPFVNFDDDRFLNALDILAEAGANGQQIIVFSCHQQRHHWAFHHLINRYPNTLLCNLLQDESPVPKKLVLIEE